MKNSVRLKTVLPIFLSILFLVSCNSSYLSVHTDYFSRENLASYYVGTPDPRLNNPPIGQRLIVTWAVPRSCNGYYSDLHLEVTIRFRNRKEVREIYPITRLHGTYVYSLLNEDYIETRGMLSYKVDLVADGKVLEQWRHQIWADLIEINHENDCNRQKEVEELGFLL